MMYAKDILGVQMLYFEIWLQKCAVSGAMVHSGANIQCWPTLKVQR